jgi:hypothetical protein
LLETTPVPFISLPHIVGDRPDRYEPRVKKRRAKEYDLMNKPRAEYKQQMAN